MSTAASLQALADAIGERHPGLTPEDRTRAAQVICDHFARGIADGAFPGLVTELPDGSIELFVIAAERLPHQEKPK